VLDRVSGQVEGLAVIPRALEAVQAHARAQIETLQAIRTHLEARAERDAAMVGTLVQVGAAMAEATKAGAAQAAEIATLGDGQRRLVDGVRDVGERTTKAMEASQAAVFDRRPALRSVPQTGQARSARTFRR